MDKQKVIHEIRSYLESELADAKDPKSPRAEELARLLVMYRFLPLREYGADDVACPAALVELEFQGTTAFYFIAPQGGGLVTRVEGKPVQVLTPNSPLGEALMGKKVGEQVRVEMREGVREYRVVSIR